MIRSVINIVQQEMGGWILQWKESVTTCEPGQDASLAASYKTIGSDILCRQNPGENVYRKVGGFFETKGELKYSQSGFRKGRNYYRSFSVLRTQQ